MHNKFKWLPMLLVPFVLTGCWDSVEINERNVVLEVAIDKNAEVDESQPINKRESYEITYTIPDMKKLSGKDSLSDDVKSSIVTKSPTIDVSVDEVESKTQDTITFSHVQAIILGEELLKDQKLFRETIDGLMRNMEMRRDTNVLAVKGKASDVSKADNSQNPILGLYIMKYFDNSERPVSYAKEQVVGNMVKELQDSNITTIPIVANDEEKNIQISGAALIKDYQLVDWLTKEEVRGLLFVEGKINKVPIVIEYQGNPLTYIIEYENSKIKFEDRVANIQIITKGNITEYISTGIDNIFSPQDIDEITQLLQKEIKQQIMVAVNKSKEINADFLNIGLAMYRKHPKLWQQNYEATWEKEGYKNMPIQIQVNSTIKNIGVLE